MNPSLFFIGYLKDEVLRHVSLCAKGETMEDTPALRDEMLVYRRHISLLLNALKKLGVSDSERKSLLR